MTPPATISVEIETDLIEQILVQIDAVLAEDPKTGKIFLRLIPNPIDVIHDLLVSKGGA